MNTNAVDLGANAADGNGAGNVTHAWLGDVLPDVPLSKAQSRVVDVIGRNPQLSSYADIAEIAQRADVNNSTVVRAAQHLGYRGWPDLQRELRSRYLVMISTEDTLTEHGEHRSPLHDALNHDIENLRLTLDSNTADDAEAAIAAMAAAKSITVVGLGSFAGPASVMAHLGSTMGYPIALENRGGVIYWFDRPGWAIAALVVGLLVLLFFRDPTRGYEGEAGVVLAPADGLITRVDSIEDPEIGPAASTAIVTFLSVFDVHVQRVPAAGEVIVSRYAAGSKVAAFREDAGRGQREAPDGDPPPERRPGRGAADRRPAGPAGGLLFERGGPRAPRPADGADQVRLAGGPPGAGELPACW